MKKIKVIQWFTGEIARHQIRLLAQSPTMELVGAFVFHEEKAGLDAGELAGMESLGVTTTNDREAMLALDADVVLYNPPLERYDEIIPILASGKNVISIMSGWNPKKNKHYPEIEEACKKGNSSLFGTGLNPGLSYELALLASSCCSEVDTVYIKTCEQQASYSVLVGIPSTVFASFLLLTRQVIIQCASGQSPRRRRSQYLLRPRGSPARCCTTIRQPSSAILS